MVAAADILKDELHAYETQKAELIARGEGKWAVVHGDCVAGLWDTYEDALQAGYDRCGLKPFLVKQVSSIERVHWIHRLQGMDC